MNLFIVEDELYMHNYLVNDIPWETMGLAVIGSFYNGEDALKAIIQEPPHIVITDLTMPKMTGIELINKSSLLGYNIAFLVISGHNDFHLVKEAFKLGVYDYLLKSEFTQDDLKKSVDKLKDNISNTLEKSDNLENKQLCRNLIWGNIKNLDIEKQLSKSNFSTNNLSIARIEIINFCDVINRFWDGEKEMVAYGLENILDEIFNEYEKSIFFVNSYTEIIIANFDVDKEQIYEYLNKIIGILNRHYKFTTTIGLSETGNYIGEFKGMYSQSVSASACSFLVGYNKIIRYEEQIYKKIDASLMNEFKTHLENEDYARLINDSGKYFLTGDYDARELKNLYKEYCNVLSDISNPTKLTLTGKCANEIKDSVVEILAKMDKEQNENRDTLSAVEKYVKKNFHRELSLRKIAAEFHVNYFHLSKQFSSKRGYTFNQFLLRVRMQNATNLLKTTDFKINEIAVMSGYNNYETFSRAFYKHYGVWPKDYREML